MFDLEECKSRLIALRKDRGYSQEQVGKIIGLSKQAINEIEKGRSKISLGNACLLADFYDVTLDYLVGRSDDKNTNQGSSTLPEELVNNFELLNDVSKGKLIERSRMLLEESYPKSLDNKKKNA